MREAHCKEKEDAESAYKAEINEKNKVNFLLMNFQYFYGCSTVNLLIICLAIFYSQVFIYIIASSFLSIRIQFLCQGN